MTRSNKDTKQLVEEAIGRVFETFGISQDDLREESIRRICESIATQARKEERAKTQGLLERLKLEFDVGVCECGEKWDETDAAIIVKEALRQIEPAKKS